ncbi:hypothetical protein [Sphingobacterium sp. LRF_L2]|uniref:hypothetical protein n=1 Tax=Sphingobacterium sp. LRF_L2 TaxID=3369421 RepID=UPI003F607BBE
MRTTLKQVAVFKTSVSTKEEKMYIMEELKQAFAGIERVSLDLSDEDAVLRLESDRIAVGKIRRRLAENGVEAVLLGFFMDGKECI